MHDRLTFVRGDLLDPISGPVDLIVSNPPYVPARRRSSAAAGGRRYEPAHRAVRRHDGLAVLQTLLETAASRLAPGGYLVMEFGFGQADRLRFAAEAAGWMISIVDDLAGIPRVLVARRS